MKNKIGIHKEVDRLGRIVIPKDMRELFKLDENVELVVTKDGVLVRNPRYRLVENDGAEDGSTIVEAMEGQKY